MNSQILLNPLQKNPLKIELMNINKLLKTSRASGAALKFISSEELIVTTSSKVIFDDFEVKEPLAQLLIAVTKSHLNIYGDGGCSLPILVTNWLKEYEMLDYGVTLSFIHDCLSNEMSRYLSLNENNSLRHKIDFNNIREPLILVSTVLTSKSSCSLTEIHQKKLSKLILTAFINSIPEEKENASIGSIIFQPVMGLNPDQSKLESGMALMINDPKIEESNFINLVENQFKRNLLCTVFASALDETLWSQFHSEDGDFETSSEGTAILKQFGVKIVENQIDIIICQKGIHPDLKLALQRKRIFVLERMGTEMAARFAELIGIKAHLTTITELANLKLRTGIIKEIKLLDFKPEAQFLLFKSEKCGIQTVFVANTTSQTCAETVRVMEQALNTLKRLAKEKFCLPGAGCTEAVLTSYLKNLMKTSLRKYSQEFECTETQLLSVVDRFSAGLINSSKPHDVFSSYLFVDDIFGHLWLEKSTFCFCGLTQRNQISNWIPATTSCLNWPIINRPLGNPFQISSKHQEALILDEFSVRKAVLETAAETCSLLLRTGVCIYSNRD